MPGLRILQVHPRLVGNLDDWSGLNNPSGLSPVLEHAKELGMNAVWFSPLTPASNIVVEREKKKVSGSLYAAIDHFSISTEFSAAPLEQNAAARNAEDDRHIRHFTAQAAASKITVMADLVFNHVALDHPLVIEENRLIEQIKRDARKIRPVYNDGSLTGMRYELADGSKHTLHFKFQRDSSYDVSVTGTNDEVWDDVAKINYNSPAAVDFFIKGTKEKPGYWKQVIDWNIDRGFTGFRCDAAYLLPPQIWAELIQHAHDRKPGVVFMGETLGDHGKANALAQAEITVHGQKQKAFDLTMLPVFWWNNRDPWMMAETHRMTGIARAGGAGSPDTHDTKHTVAELYMRHFAPETVASISVRDYAVSAFIGNSVFMQMGYEYCRPQIDVFRQQGLTAYWNKLQQERGAPHHPLNLTSRLKTINDFKAKIQKPDSLVRMDNISMAAPHLVKIECTLTGQDRQAQGRLVLYVNEKPESGPVRLDCKNAAKSENSLTMNFNAAAGGQCEVRDVAAVYTPVSAAQPAPSP